MSLDIFVKFLYLKGILLIFVILSHLTRLIFSNDDTAFLIYIADFLWVLDYRASYVYFLIIFRTLKPLIISKINNCAFFESPPNSVLVLQVL